MNRIKEDFSLMASLLIPVAVAINFTGFGITRALSLPLFLDSIGTVFISLIAGPWVGSVTAIITSLITGGLAPENLAFLPVGILIAVIAGTVTKYKTGNFVAKTVVCAVILILGTVISSSAITILVYGGITPNPTGMVTSFLVSKGVSLEIASFTANCMSEVMDKTLTVAIAMLIVKSMSERNLIKFKYGENYIKSKV